ncbi:MAG: DUF4280 domain-containing protein [Flavobacteriaceae bacterium]|nr:DUF4280 domain-containing protein [Flavobacteriaceae bacterium]
MSNEGKLVCHNAECECEHGNIPDKLTVTTQSKRYINDPDGSSKLIATNKEIGTPFEKKTFGQCKLQPSGFSYKPCQPMITDWEDVYENITLEDNNGNPLLEGSKAICSIAGVGCVSITFHGQTAAPIAQNFEQEEQEQDTASQVNPLVKPSAVLQSLAELQIQAKKI